MHDSWYKLDWYGQERRQRRSPQIKEAQQS